MSKTIITPVAIMSYPNLFEPRKAGPNDEPKYSVALVFPAGTDLTALKEAALQAARDKWGSDADAMLRSGKLRSPFRTDVEAKGYPEGAVFFNARTKKRPGVVSRVPDPKTGRPMPITDESEIYAGALVKASVTAFAYDTNGNRGVSFGLGNIQKWDEGEPLAGSSSAAMEFEADPNMVADLSDLTEEDETATVTNTRSLTDLM